MASIPEPKAVETVQPPVSPDMESHSSLASPSRASGPAATTRLAEASEPTSPQKPPEQSPAGPASLVQALASEAAVPAAEWHSQTSAELPGAAAT